MFVHILFSQVFGVDGGVSSVEQLRSKVSQLLQEYVVSRDTHKAMRCLAGLRVPQFHHEVVFQAVTMAIDGRNHEEVLTLSYLLRSLGRAGGVSPTQFNKGLDRVLAVLSDLCVHNPRATQGLDAFCRVSSTFIPRG
jgi:programmed cell death protein 4